MNAEAHVGFTPRRSPGLDDLAAAVLDIPSLFDPYPAEPPTPPPTIAVIPLAIPT
jgi:hypothetical protein